MSSYHDYVELFSLCSYLYTLGQFLTIKTDFTIDEGKAFLEEFSKCKCCKRHQTNRPCKVEELSTDVALNDYKDCKCDCRHASRILCHTLKAMEPNTDETEMEPHDATLVIG